MRGRTDGLLAIPQAVGESRRQSRGPDFFLRGRDIIVEPVEFDQVFFQIKSNVASLGLAVARLANGTDIEKILAADFQFDPGVQATLDSVGPPHKPNRNMRMPVETDLSVVVVKAIGSRKLIENVRPFLRQIERGMDNGKTLDLPDILQIAQPGPLFFAQLFPRPPDGLGRQDIKPGQVHVAGAVLVMIAHDSRTIEAANQVQTFDRVRAVTNNVSQTDIVRTLLLLGVGKDGLQSFKVAVNITENGEFHDSVSRFGNSRAGAGLSSRFSSPQRARPGATAFAAVQERISKPINSLVGGRQLMFSFRI